MNYLIKHTNNVNYVKFFMWNIEQKVSAYYVFADFETTPGIDTNISIWGFWICAYYKRLNTFKKISYHYGINLTSFIQKLYSFERKIKIYFHNLSGFDGSFIIKGLEAIGYSPLAIKDTKNELKVTNRCNILRINKDEKIDYKNKYVVLFNNTKKILSIKIYGGKKGGRGQKYIKLEFNCSLLLMPGTSVAKMGKELKMEKLGESVDYTKFKIYKSIDEIPQNQLIYLKRDIDILTKYMISFLTKQGVKGIRMTSASTSYFEFQRTLWNKKTCEFLGLHLSGNPKDGYTINGKKTVARKKHVLVNRYVNKGLFPVKWIQNQPFIRHAYNGGISYVNPSLAGMTLKNVISFDINSSYPSVMVNELFPYGEPLIDEKINNDYPIKIYKVKVYKAVNEKGLPFIPTNQNEYVNKKVNYYGRVIEDKVIYITCAEFKRFKKYYKGKYEAFVKYQFKAVEGDILFGEYIKKWYNTKKTTKDKMLRFIAKIFLNSLYGKFGSKTERKIHYFSKEHFENGWFTEDVITKQKYYLPVGVFITAYARLKLVDAVGLNGNKMIYCDTDSLYLLKKDLKYFTFKISDELGAWKQELGGDTVTFRRAKAYTTGKKSTISAFKVRDRIIDHHELLVGFSNLQLQGKQANCENGKYLETIEKVMVPIWKDRTQPDSWYAGMDKETFIKNYRLKLNEDMIDLSDSFENC